MTTTPLFLLSFRKNAASIVEKDSDSDFGRDDDDDDDDDDDGNGWVHGGKYVPAATASAAKRRPSSSSASRPSAATASTPANVVPSPYSMLSPPALSAPLPPDPAAVVTAGSSSSSNDAARTSRDYDANTPRPNSGAATTASFRTPLTVQLQRLLLPTPANPPPSPSATSVGAAVASSMARTPVDRTPNEFQRGRPTPPPPPPATPVEKFLRQSGVTPGISHYLGNVAFHLTSLIFSVVVFILDGIASQWNALTTKYPHMASDVIESIFETVVEILTLLWDVARFLSPYLLWTLQTLIALTLTLGGTILWASVLLVRGREKADDSGAGEARSSAVKSLRESMRNSPFKRRRGEWDGNGLPFMGFSGASTPSSQQSEDVQQRSMDLAMPGANENAGDSATSASMANYPMAYRSTPTVPGSAIRSATRGSNLRQTPHASTVAAAQTPASANARRVLFSETEHGEVSTEQFHYDKNLPASARKVDHRAVRSLEENGMEGETGSGGREHIGLRRRFPTSGEDVKEAASRTSATFVLPPAASSLTSAASPSATPENTILRPSKYFEQKKDDSLENKGGKAMDSAVATGNAALATGASTKVAEPWLSAEEEEKKKQEYIKRYGLLPTITPLSKRYGRMKQRQQQGQANNGLSASSNASLYTTETNNAANGTKLSRKRRGNLLGAASRLGRHRRARVGANGSLLPLLGRNRTPMKRRRDEGGMSRADEWVWRAMSRDGKENQDSLQVGSVAKRGKFRDGKDNKEVLGTPPKNAASSLSHVATPPKTPGPSMFVAAATPAPRKSGGGMNEKPSIPSFSFGGGGTASGEGTERKTAIDGGAPGFSFGASASAAGGTEKENPTAPASTAPSFSFGAPAVAPDSTAKKDATAPANTAPGFSFGAPAAGGTEKKAETAPVNTAPILSHVASSAAAQPAEKKDVTAGTTPSFSFGAPANAAQPAEKKDKSMAMPGFSFGNTSNNNNGGASKSAESNAPPAASAPFSFGGLTKPATSFAGQQKEAAPASSSGAFSFGTTAPAGGAASFGTAAPVAPTTAQFSFGAPSQPAPDTAAQFTHQPASSSIPGFSFGATASAAAPGAMPVAPATRAGPPSFSFGAGAASSGAAPPAFGAVTAGTSFNLGGSSSTGGGGASARRRAAKSGGRRR